MDITSTVIMELKNRCICNLTDYTTFNDGKFICFPGIPEQVVYTGKLYHTVPVSTTDILMALKDWLSNDMLTVLDEQFVGKEVCIYSSKSLQCELLSTRNVSTEATTDLEGDSTQGPAINIGSNFTILILLGIVILIFLVLLTATLIYLQSLERKKSIRLNSRI